MVEACDHRGLQKREKQKRITQTGRDKGDVKTGQRWERLGLKPGNMPAATKTERGQEQILPRAFRGAMTQPAP